MNISYFVKLHLNFSCLAALACGGPSNWRVWRAFATPLIVSLLRRGVRGTPGDANCVTEILGDKNKKGGGAKCTFLFQGKIGA